MAGERRLVQEVCREWLVHEDNALAHRLQEEENETHYGKNRSERRLVREDLTVAKTAQQDEDDEATQIQRMYEQMLLDQELADARVAQSLQEVEEQELNKLRHYEEEDEALARQLQDKEKTRFERKKREKKVEHERKQVERARTQVTNETVITGQFSPVAEEAITPSHSRSRGQYESTSPVDETTSPMASNGYTDDLSDFCIKPTPDMDLDSVRHLQEEQDAELARLLQEQETKRSGYSDRDRQMAIEAQDRELARVLQEQERAKARRAKERARLRALQRQQQAEQLAVEDEATSPVQYRVSRGDSTHSHSSLEERADSPLSRAVSRPVRPTELEVPVTINHIGPETARHSSREQQGGRSSSQSSSEYMERIPSERGTSNTHTSVNIAMAIDPTYNRRRRTTPAASTTPVVVYNCDADSGGSTPVLPSPVSIRTGTYQGDDGFYDSDEGPAPPYMPIQGQVRNNASLEKKKKGKNKESCKQQ